MFIELGKRLINLDHVREIVHEPDDEKGRPKVSVIFADGTERSFTCAWRYLERRLKGTLIAAPPGWQVAVAVYEGPHDRGQLCQIDTYPGALASSYVQERKLSTTLVNVFSMYTMNGRNCSGYSL